MASNKRADRSEKTKASEAPDVWEVKFSQAKGRSYYVNKTTGQKSWEKPPSFEETATTTVAVSAATTAHAAALVPAPVAPASTAAPTKIEEQCVLGQEVRDQLS